MRVWLLKEGTFVDRTHAERKPWSDELIKLVTDFAENRGHLELGAEEIGKSEKIQYAMNEEPPPLAVDDSDDESPAPQGPDEEGSGPKTRRGTSRPNYAEMSTGRRTIEALHMSVSQSIQIYGALAETGVNRETATTSRLESFRPLASQRHDRDGQTRRRWQLHVHQGKDEPLGRSGCHQKTTGGTGQPADRGEPRGSDAGCRHRQTRGSFYLSSVGWTQQTESGNIRCTRGLFAR